jgi:hypothetical protein
MIISGGNAADSCHEQNDTHITTAQQYCTCTDGMARVAAAAAAAAVDVGVPGVQTQYSLTQM